MDNSIISYKRRQSNNIVITFVLIIAIYSFNSQASNTARKIKFSIIDLFSKCDQIRRKMQIWSHLLKKEILN